MTSFKTAALPLLRLVAATAAVAFFGGCQPIDAALDCNTICNRYKTCYDGSYDVAACASRCRDQGSKDSNYAASINRCEACIDDRACASATFNCAGDCSKVVP